MPLSVLLAFIFLLQALFSIDLSSAALISGGLFGAIAASFYCDFMKDKQSSRIAANIRGGIIVTALTYFFVSLLSFEIPMQERFAPNINNFVASICALYTWVSVILTKSIFNARKRFEIITGSYQDEKLQEKLFEDSALLYYTSENINKAWENYLVQLGIIGFFAVYGAVNRITLPLSLNLFLIFILAGAVGIYGLFEIIKWEQYHASEGINLSEHNRAKRIFAIIIFSIIGIIIAAIFASDRTYIPLSVITGFFAWIFSFIKINPSTTRKAPLPELPSDAALMPAIPEEMITPSPIMEQIVKYTGIFFKYGLILLAAGLFVRFMIAPLVNRGDAARKLPFFLRLVLIIIEWFKGLLSAIVSFIKGIKDNNAMLKLRKTNEEQLRRAAENIFNAYSPAKKRNIRQSVTLFARLIIWGSEERDVTWKPSFAPGEYCALLAASPPVVENVNIDLQKQNEQIIICGVLFEKALYSKDILSEEELSEFKTLIEEITFSVKN
jgi:hypothetical protein